jgi:hypothetical protein
MSLPVRVRPVPCGCIRYWGGWARDDWAAGRAACGCSGAALRRPSRRLSGAGAAGCCAGGDWACLRPPVGCSTGGGGVTCGGGATGARSVRELPCRATRSDTLTPPESSIERRRRRPVRSLESCPGAGEDAPCRPPSPGRGSSGTRSPSQHQFMSCWRAYVCPPAPPGVTCHPALAIVRSAAASDDSARKYFHYKYAVAPIGLVRMG